MPRRRYHEAMFDDDDDFSSKRSRPDRDTVESLLYRIGCKDTDKLQKDISELGLLVCTELAKNPDHYVRIFASCAKNIPERAHIYSTLLGLINLKNHTFVAQTVDLLFRELKDSLKSCKFDDAKYLVRFLSYLVNSNVVHPASLLGLYENFTEVTLDVCASSQARTDWYSYIVLYALPYSAPILAEHKTAALNATLSTISLYLSKRRLVHVPILSVWDSNIPHPQEDYLSCLWAQICSMRSAGWKEHVLCKISDSFPALRESGQPCKLSQLTPPDYDPEIVYPLPHVIFRMFDYTDVYAGEDEEDAGEAKLENSRSNNVNKASKPGTMPGAHTIERFLVDEQIHIILETMNFNRALCAKALLNLTTRARVALDYMIVEAIFADIFRLPRPPVLHGNLLFYGSLFIQLCNDASNTMPLVLAQATETLFERLDTMKPVCISRFVEWFSFHLTNYQLQWSWRDWSRALDEPVMSPRRWFISETLRRLIRYSYLENVKQRLPRSFHCLLPPEPAPINPYANSSVSKLRAFNRVLDAFRDRRSPESLLKLINRLAKSEDHEGAGSDGDEDDASSTSSSRRSSQSAKGSASEDDEKDQMNSSKRRPRVTARRRMASSNESGAEGDAEKVDREAVDEGEDPLLRTRTTTARNASPPRLDDVNVGQSVIGYNQCLTVGVTSRALELFMTALLYRAHKTISHTCSLLKRYSDTFRHLASSVEAQVESLHILQAVWVNHSQMVVVISDYMCRNGLLDPEAIVRWAFSPYMTAFKGSFAPAPDVYVRPRILELHVWECLLHTLIRAGQRVSQINAKLEAAKESLDLHRRKSASDSSNDSDDEIRRSHVGRHNVDDEPTNMRHHGRSRRRRGSGNVDEIEGEGREGDPEMRRSTDRVARLEEERCEVVRSQCAVITVLLHRHVRLIDVVEEAMRELENQFQQITEDQGEHNLTTEDLGYISYWLKGRFTQTVLEHQDQLLPYMDNLKTLMSDVCQFVHGVFEALHSLYA